MAVKCEMHGDIAVVTPGGTLWGGDETGKLKETVDGLIAQNNAKLVIDLGNVNHLNSTALGVLVQAHGNYKGRNGAVKLARVEKRINNILVITKLSMVFEVFENVDAAVASFK